MGVAIELPERTRTLVQCDFDGTITEEDVSFMMLDAYADGDWRHLFREYQEGRITVGRFNTDAFAMVKADKDSLLRVFKKNIEIRPSFQELVDYCRGQDFRFVVVSNGLDFYIKEVLRDIGLADIEVFSARTRFKTDGISVQYIGPDGNHLDTDFKGAYVDSFLGEGYRVIYIGNGTSDIAPAGKCSHIFATGALLDHYKQTGIDYTAFTDFNQVIKGLKLL